MIDTFATIGIICTHLGCVCAGMFLGVLLAQWNEDDAARRRRVALTPTTRIDAGMPDPIAPAMDLAEEARYRLNELA